jgi:hypothetical protein
MTTEPSNIESQVYGTTISSHVSTHLLETQKPSQKVFYTNSTSAPDISLLPDEDSFIENEILSETTATILGVEKDLVQVKLDSDLIVHFPIELFEDQSILLVGQQLKYQITRVDGYRQQAFIKDNRMVDESNKEEFLDLLNQIELRQDNDSC